MSLSSQSDALYPRPSHALGEESQRRILCDESHFRIYHESLIQNEQHSRFYHFPNDAFIFVLAGHAYLADSENGLALAQYQGCWISPTQVHKLVLLSPTLELLVIAYQGNLAPCAEEHYLVNQANYRPNGMLNSIDRQTISRINSLSIELESYPSQQAEHLHYHRHSDQFIIALKGQLNLQLEKQDYPIEEYDWVLVKAKQRHQLNNPSQHKSMCLSIYSPPPAKDRVLVLKRQELQVKTSKD